MAISELFDEWRKEWPVIRQAPLLFCGALVIMTTAISGSVYAIFRANLDRKNDLIKTLQDQVTARDKKPADVFLAPSSPSFRLLMQGGNVFIPDQAPTLTGILLDVIVTNTGKPSVALDWKLTVIPKQGEPKLTQITKMPPSLVARGEHNTAFLNASESLMESTLSEPLQTDIPRAGRLLFYTAMPKDAVMSSVFDLSVTDVTGKSYFARQDVNDWISR